jgi:hypothetical protein
MTKKILALILVLSMVLAFAACGGKDKDGSDSSDKGSDIIGEYSLVKAELNGVELDADQLSSLGDYTFDFKEGGKVSMIQNGADLGEGNYTVEGDKITVTDPSGVAMEMSRVGNTISFTEETSGVTMTFEKK